jgi:hypothetical protein
MAHAHQWDDARTKSEIADVEAFFRIPAD